ncbi:MAG: hypothetical protein H0U53_11090 [Actinobacteria bacterium]|nr:hypothetical protein [Actinomycetota bacterium]
MATNDTTELDPAVARLVNNNREYQEDSGFPVNIEGTGKRCYVKKVSADERGFVLEDIYSGELYELADTLGEVRPYDAEAALEALGEAQSETNLSATADNEAEVKLKAAAAKAEQLSTQAEDAERVAEAHEDAKAEREQAEKDQAADDAKAAKAQAAKDAKASKSEKDDA